MDLVGINDYAGLTIILSLAPWFALLNLGLPNTTQNLISRLRAVNKSPKRFQQAAVDAAYSVGWIYLVPVIFVSAGVHQALVGQHGDLSYVAVVALTLGLGCSGLGAIFQQILHATHRSIWPTLAPAIQFLLTTILLYSQLLFNFTSDVLVAMAIALPMLLIFFGGGWLVDAKFRWKVDWRVLKILISESKGFLFFGAAGAVAISSDYVVMARLLSSEEIAEYSLVTKAFSIILTLHVVWLAAFWTPLSDLFYRKDYASMRKKLIRLLILGFGLALSLGLLLILSINTLAQIFTNNRIVFLQHELVIFGLIYVLIRIWSDTFATALLSCNQLKVVNGYIVAQSIISIASQLWLAKLYGAVGILLGIVISFGLTAAWILPYHFFKITRSK